MDNEYHEYALLSQLLKSAKPYQEGYRFCQVFLMSLVLGSLSKPHFQIQVEVHGHLEKPEILKRFAEFVRQMFSEAHFVPVHSMQSVHIRYVFF